MTFVLLFGIPLTMLTFLKYMQSKIASDPVLLQSYIEEMNASRKSLHLMSISLKLNKYGKK